MKNIKNVIKTGLVSVVLAGGVALPASAATQTNNCNAALLALSLCSNSSVHVDNSVNRSRTLGNGSAIIRTNVTQTQTTTATTNQGNVGGASAIGIGGSGSGTGLGLGGGGGLGSSSSTGVGIGVGGAGSAGASNNQSNGAITSAHGSQSSDVHFAPRF